MSDGLPMRMAKAGLRPTLSTVAKDSTSEQLLSPTTYRVFRSVPDEWWDEREVRDEISTALALTLTDVGRRLQNLVKMGLLERRKRQTIAPVNEIRKVGK